LPAPTLQVTDGRRSKRYAINAYDERAAYWWQVFWLDPLVNGRLLRNH